MLLGMKRPETEPEIDPETESATRKALIKVTISFQFSLKESQISSEMKTAQESKYSDAAMETNMAAGHMICNRHGKFCMRMETNYGKICQSSIIYSLLCFWFYWKLKKEFYRRLQVICKH